MNEANDKPKLVRERVLVIYRDHYDDDKTDEEILQTDPNDYERDPANFMEDVDNTFFGISSDLRNPGGTVAEIIQWVVANWDGKDYNPDWLDDMMPEDIE